MNLLKLMSLLGLQQGWDTPHSVLLVLPFSAVLFLLHHCPHQVPCSPQLLHFTPFHSASYSSLLYVLLHLSPSAGTTGQEGRRVRCLGKGVLHTVFEWRLSFYLHENKFPRIFGLGIKCAGRENVTGYHNNRSHSPLLSSWVTTPVQG